MFFNSCLRSSPLLPSLPLTTRSSRQLATPSLPPASARPVLTCPCRRGNRSRSAPTRRPSARRIQAAATATRALPPSSTRTSCRARWRCSAWTASACCTKPVCGRPAVSSMGRLWRRRELTTVSHHACTCAGRLVIFGVPCTGNFRWVQFL